MGLKLITAPSTEPITLAEAKLQCKQDGNDDDALITALIVSARQQAEQRTGGALVEQTLELSEDAFPTGNFELVRLKEITSITYLDSDGVRQTLADTEYQVVVSDLVGVVFPAYGKTWPTCRAQPGSVVVTFKAGFAVADSRLAGLKSWIKLAVATLYAQREAVIPGVTSELPRIYFDGLLDYYWVYPR